MINIRLASLTDSDTLYKWRNDAIARKMSCNTNVIDIKTHHDWLTSSLQNKNRLLLICENEDRSKKIAVVRFDVKYIRARVSINLSPSMRGLGMSQRCLKEAIKILQKEFPQVKILEAKTKIENIPSRKLFESVGFKNIGDDANFFHFEYLI